MKILILIFSFVAAQCLAASGDLDTTFGTAGVATADYQGANDETGSSIAVQSDGKILFLVNSGSAGSGFATVIRYQTNGSVDATFVAPRFEGFGAGDIAVQADGRIVVAGWYGGQMMVARLNSSGTLDTGFDGDGMALANFGIGGSGAAIAIQADGRIVVGANVGSDVGLARFNTNGTPDTTFDGDGRVYTDLPDLWNTLSDIALQSDGKIVTIGYHGNNTAVAFQLLRYNTNGSLDSTFDSDGILQDSGYGSNLQYGSSVVIQTDGKIVAAGNVAFSNFAIGRYNTNGSLDTTWNGTGRATVDFSGGQDRIESTAIQSDGKVVVVGRSYHAGSGDFAIARFNTNGTLDSSFDGDGKLLTDLGTPYDVASRILVQSDGKILAAGTYEPAGNSQAVILRYATNGALDSTFDSDGILEAEDFSGSADDFASGIALQPDGKIVLAGTTNSTGGTRDLALARFDLDGNPDSSFGVDGKTTADLVGTGETGRAVALQADGKILVAGNAYNGSEDFAVARFNTDGSLDATFNGAGFAITDISDSRQDIAYGVAVQQNGRIVLAGSSCLTVPPYGCDFALARYLPDGNLDSSFGAGGIVQTDFLSGDEVLFAVALQNDGKILAAGYTYYDSTTYDFAVLRYNSNGTPDGGFGSGGLVTTDFQMDEEFAYSVVQQSDGKILVGGYTNGVDYDFALVRYKANGAPDDNFGVSGKVTTNLPGDKRDSINVLALMPNGKIIAVGFTGTGNGTNAAVVRYLPDGNPDSSFSEDGVAVVDLAPSQEDDAAGVAVAPDGKILIGGTMKSAGTGKDMVVARVETGEANLLLDDFEDSIRSWIVKKETWSELDGDLVGAGNTKAIAFAPLPWSPSGQSECSICTIEFDVEVDGGVYSKVFVEGWYQNGSNKVDLILNESADKWILKQRSGGGTIASAKVVHPIVPGERYNVQLSYDGSDFHLIVDGVQVLILKAGATPSGNLALKVKNTTARFGHFRIY